MRPHHTLIPLITLALITACSAPSSNPTSASSSAQVSSSSSQSLNPQPTASPEASPSQGPSQTSSQSSTQASPDASSADPTSPEPHPTGTVITVEASQPAAPESSPAASPQPERPAANQQPTASSLAGVPLCDYGQIYIEAAVLEGGAAGSRYINLTFTNTGKTDCAMSGYPAVHYVNAAGQQIGAPAAKASEWSSNGGVLSPGASLPATLRETRAQLYGESCQSVSARGYSITTPGASQPLILTFAAEACSNSAISQLSVGAVGATP